MYHYTSLCLVSFNCDLKDKLKKVTLVLVEEALFIAIVNYSDDFLLLI